MGGRSAAAPAAFEQPLHIPPVLKPKRRLADHDVYELTMRPATVEIIPGTRTPIWGFNGQFPGPTIRVEKGRPAVVRQVNRLPSPVATHLHGGYVSPKDDGHPMDLVDAGDGKNYFYPNDQLSATLWYHDHTHRHTSRNVYRGLAGLYIIEDPDELALDLPKDEYDVPLIIQDRTFGADGSMKFADHHDAVLGDAYLVNGRPTPFFEVANRKYRFRILNASNSRNYTLALDSLLPLTQIASDGGLLAAPYTTPTIPLWPAERAEIVIDFSTYPVGTSVTLVDQINGDPTQTKPIVRFDVVRQEADTSSLPSTLRPVEKLAPGQVEREFELTLDPTKNLWLINGKSFRHNRIDARPRRDEVEVWSFKNSSNMTHPMHIHLSNFQILDRDGVPPSAGESGWKDTVRVESQEVVRVAIKFIDFTGRYVFHCHNLPHEDHGMMAQLEVAPPA
jgi:FtsP/CotA-like multicopper oxidase with cupredoxin domain